MTAFVDILLGGVFHAAVLFLVAAGLQLCERYRVPRDAILTILNRVTAEDELNPKRMMDMIRGELGGWAPPFIATIPHDPLVRAQQVNFGLPIDKRDGFRKGIDALVDYFYSSALAGSGYRPQPGPSRFGIRLNLGGR